jgi:hypothetical protein
MIGWLVNHGREKAPEFYPASRYRERFRRPDVIDLVLEKFDPGKAATKADSAVGRRSASIERQVTALDAGSIEVPCQRLPLPIRERVR